MVGVQAKVEHSSGVIERQFSLNKLRPEAGQQISASGEAVCTVQPAIRGRETDGDDGRGARQNAMNGR